MSNLDEVSVNEMAAEGVHWKTAALNYRFRLEADLTQDGVFTISDVWEWLKWVYFAPGDLIAIFLLDTSLGNFLEISLDSISGIGSGVVSLVLWLFLLGFLSAALDG